MEFSTLVFSLFLIMDPIGNIPLFSSILSQYDLRRQRQIIIREQFISLGILISFQFLGNWILDWLSITIPSLQVAGGTILFLIALGMIFPHIKTAGEGFDNTIEPFIVPLSVPLVAGPTILAAIMVYSHQYQQPFKMFLAIAAAWLITSMILLLTPWFKKIMNDQAMTACTRLMGLILTFISIQMLLDGIRNFII